MQSTDAVGYDIGPFALVPTWLIQVCDSAPALRVYVALASFAGADRTCWPSRKTIGERAGIDSEDVVKRALRTLDRLGAITRRDQYLDGRQTTNVYVVHLISPADRGGDAADSAIPGGGDKPSPHEGGRDVTPIEQTSRNRPDSLSTGRGDEPVDPLAASIFGRRVDRIVVSTWEASKAAIILATWNELSGQKMRSTEFLSKIVMRIREYPEATAEDHRRIIEANLARPWWKGAPNPSVIYGSSGQFERSIVQTQAATAAAGMQTFEQALRALQEG